MATRIFCDNCGNTIKEAIVYSYGPYKQIRREENERLKFFQAQQAHMNVGAGMGVGGASGGTGGIGHLGGSPVRVPSTSSVAVEMVHVDLCTTCVPIWMNRVRNLTQQSDPEEK